MCTIGYHKDLNIIFKTRDKATQIKESIITGDKIIACKSQDATYYSWGLNKHGCGFVSAAINSPKWTKLIYEGKYNEADKQYINENNNLDNPIIIVSEILPDITDIEEWINALKESNINSMGYNLLISDSIKAYLLELYKNQIQIKKLSNNEIITNHFHSINHGPKIKSDYPSSFFRYDYANKQITSAESIDHIISIVEYDHEDENKQIWRKGSFSTVSASIINLNELFIYYSNNRGGKYSSISFADNTEKIITEDLSRFEMSRYINLELYHEVERSHPFYIEMIDYMCEYLKNNCQPNKKYKILELGAGTGLFTQELLKLPFLEVTSLEIDDNCCKLLKKHVRNKNLEIVCGDAVTFCKKSNYDFVVSTFAHDHIHFDRAEEFIKNIHSNLKNGGRYIMGGEILPYYSNEDERKQALYKYHCFIVNKALYDTNYRVAQIEINALESGIDMIGDFKRHEGVFEKEMESSGLVLESKKKIGPDDYNDVGGVFVYTYLNKSNNDK